MLNIAGWGYAEISKITSNRSKFTNFSDDLIVYFIKSSLMQSFPCTDENFQKLLNIALWNAIYMLFYGKTGSAKYFWKCFGTDSSNRHNFY